MERASWGPFDYDHIGRQFLLIEEHHAEQLTAAATYALRESRYRDAFMYADRRCRIKPIADASDYLLRACILSRIGEHDLARADLKTALEIDPNHQLANLTALHIAEDGDRLSHATAIIRSDHTSSAAREAIGVISESFSAIGAFTATADGINGWCLWKTSSPLHLQITSDVDLYVAAVAPDPTHPLGDLFGHAAEITLDWPPDATYAAIEMPGQKQLVLNDTLLRPSSSRKCQRRRVTTIRKQADSVVIVIPIYGDYDATRRCLASLTAAQQVSVYIRVVLVNDATPDQRIQGLMTTYAQMPGFSVLTHKINLGFARSVNDALATLNDEDVIILNSDTIVPPGFISRLRDAAYAAPDIGTVTPFSNNGEYTSFPVPFRENPLPELKEVVALDRFAAKANTGRIIEMPNGTAFCMYVTRACLDSIGPLSTSFGRGYYEDVEFCLRATKAGFRNVCAADVYVGHEGSKSFGASKRALVTRNLATLEVAYPSYRMISAAFMEEDPLALARQAIEAAAFETKPTCLVLAPHGLDERFISRRCTALSSKNDRVLLAAFRLSAGTIRINIQAPDGGMPQTLHRYFSVDDAPEAFSFWFEELGVSQVEIMAFDETPRALAQAALHGPFAASLLVPRSQAESSSESGPTRFSDDQDDTNAWVQALYSVDAILTLDDETHQRMIVRFGHEKTIEPAFERPRAEHSLLLSACYTFETSRLAVIGTEASITQSFLTQLTDNTAPALLSEIVFVGTAFDDLRLMAGGLIFCTGSIEPSELADVMRLYQVSHVLILDEGIVNAGAYEAVLAAGLRCARIVETSRSPMCDKTGLVIPADSSIAQIVEAINGWIALQRSETGYG